MRTDVLLQEAGQADDLSTLRSEIMAGNVADVEPKENETLPASYHEIELQLIEGLEAVEELNSRIEAMKAKLYASMEEAGVKQWKSERMTITRTEPSTRFTFDSKRFQKEDEETYNKYLKSSTTKGGVRITIRKAS